MKKYLIIIILLVAFIDLNAQDSLDSISISIDWTNETNRNHKYKDIFSSKDEDYIKWIYKTSKSVSKDVADNKNDKKYYHDGSGNNPLVFTIKVNNEVRTEVYRNVVKPSKKKNSIFSVFIPKYKIPKIEGKLPKGVITYYSDSSKGIEIGIETDNNSRNVKIEILDMNSNVIHMIEDSVLDKGWAHYKWDTKDIESGSYILKYSVDENVMTQVIEIENYKGSYISRFFNWLF